MLLRPVGAGECKKPRRTRSAKGELRISDCGLGRKEEPQMNADERGGGFRQDEQDGQDSKDGSCAPTDEGGSMATAVQRGRNRRERGEGRRGILTG